MKSLRIRALDLRKRGWSYCVISQRLGVAKSTLSDWLRSVPYVPNQAVVRRIKGGPAKTAELKRQRVLSEIRTCKQRAHQDIGRLSRRDLWFLGLGLYIGEGSKLFEEVRIINSDPQVIRLAMRWLREVCHVPNRNFCVSIHLYPDTSSSSALSYWSKITGVPKGQFGKIQVDRRLDKSFKKRRRLPYGTAHVKVCSRGNRRFGVALHRRIIGWIDALYEIMRA